MTVHTNLDQAFHQADVVILLEESSDSEKEEEEEEKRRKVKDISDRYREYGRLIDTRAKKEVKVIVSGDSYVSLRCWLLLESVSSIDRHQFVATATQLENEARSILATKLRVKTSGSSRPVALSAQRNWFYDSLFFKSSSPDVTNIILWGNISGSFHIDLQRARVFNYDGAIKGPAFFSQPVLTVLHDRCCTLHPVFIKHYLSVYSSAPDWSTLTVWH